MPCSAKISVTLQTEILSTEISQAIDFFKVVICGKYINLNKITKTYHIFLKFNRLLIFVIFYSLQCKIEGQAV